MCSPWKLCWLKGGGPLHFYAALQMWVTQNETQINISAPFLELGLNAFHRQLLVESDFFGYSGSSFSSRGWTVQRRVILGKPGNELLGKGLGFLSPLLSHWNAQRAAPAHHPSSAWANGTEGDTSRGPFVPSWESWLGEVWGITAGKCHPWSPGCAQAAQLRGLETGKKT